MAVLKINSSVHDVIKRTLTWLDSAYNRWNLRRTHNIEKRPGDTRYEIRAQGKANFFNFLLNLNITKESEKSTSVLIEAHLDKSSKLPVYILYLLHILPSFLLDLVQQLLKREALPKSFY